MIVHRPLILQEPPQNLNLAVFVAASAQVIQLGGWSKQIIGRSEIMHYEN